MSDSGKLVIKLVEENIVRRIRVDRTTFTFADLVASASGDTCTCLSYLDDEHEAIHLACNEDFVEAKNCCWSGVLRVLIQDKNDLDIVSGHIKLSAQRKYSVDATPSSVPIKTAHKTMNKTPPPVPPVPPASPPSPAAAAAAAAESSTPTNACNSRHGDCKLMRHVGNHMLAFITLTVFGPYALKLMLGIFCSLIAIACRLFGIGLKIVPLLVLGTVLKKSYKSIRGDKDETPKTVKKKAPGLIDWRAEVPQVPDFSAFTKVFSNGTCALW